MSHTTSMPRSLVTWSIVVAALFRSQPCLALKPPKGGWNVLQDKNHSPWIDPDTPQVIRKIVSYQDGLLFYNDYVREFDLVFSDEFNADDRTMQDGQDPRWTALHSDDLTNNPLHWYSHDNVRTKNGALTIQMDVHPQQFTYTNKTRAQTKEDPTPHEYNVSKEFRSGMVQSWNKFCFTGGIIEMSAKMPGRPDVGGLWPAMWMMGNLARATYLDTTDHMWPFSTNVCTKHTRYSQEINACDPNPGYGMHPHRGRGAPEVDFFEVMYMDVLPSPLLSASLQLAPGKARNRPALGRLPNVTWYDPVLRNGAYLNQYFFGTHTYDRNKTVEYFTDSVSINYWLNESFYDEFHTFRIEWEPPVDHMGDSLSTLSRGGYIKWFIDGKLISGIVGDKLRVVSDTEIPSEPMYIILNQALSRDWGFPDAYFLNCPKKCWSCLDPSCKCAMPPNFCKKNIPATFEIDYVRVYQIRNDPRYTLGCSPPKRPTAEWIAGHNERYILWRSPPGTIPLQPIQRGGMACTSDATCGGDDRGYCNQTLGCLCRAGWTGPTCLSPYTDDDTTTDMTGGVHSTPAPAGEVETVSMPVVGFTTTPVTMIVVFAVIAAAVFLWRKKYKNQNPKKEGYEIVP